MRDTLIGTRINRYEIRESIHKSDVLGIYKAYDTKLERFVLIKTILHSGDYTKEAVDYFLSESKTLAKLAHPNIAKVLDFGFENGNLYLISEFVSGTSLSDLMNQPMAWQNAVNILLPLTDALIYAHSRGIIHRDLKPDNITINTDDQPILSDFSLMRIIEEEETRDMTGTNVGLGSPGYISPEQGQGMTADFRSDIYSLGVIFFEMVTGKKLFYATNSMEIVIQHIMADPPKPRTLIPTLPRMVENVILSALSKDREKRYQTMEEFSNALKAVVTAYNREKNKNNRRPNRLVIFSSIGVALLLFGFGYFVFRNWTAATISATTPPPPTEATLLTPTPQPASTTETPATLTISEPASDGPFDSLPALPVIYGTQLPASNQVLGVNNANQIQELARWGKPSIRQFAWINNDQTILAATSAGIYFLDPNDLSARAFFDTQGSLIAFTVSEDDEWVATADETGEIAVWNIADGKLLHRLTDPKYRPTARILSLAFSPDKSKLVFSDANKQIHFWNIEQDQYYPFEPRLAGNANKVTFALDAGGDTDADDTVISAGEENRIMIWDVPSRDLKSNADRLATSQKIYDMALSADDRYAAVALNDGIIEIWDLYKKQAEHKPERKIELPESERKPFTFITFLSESLVITGSADGYLRLWNTSASVANWAKTSTDQFERGTTYPVKTVAVSRNGERLVVEFANGLVEVWDLTDIINQAPNVIASKSLGSSPIKSVAISQDDQTVAYQGGDSFVKLVSIADTVESAPIIGRLPRGNPISPDSEMIAIIQLKDTKNIINLHRLSVTEPNPLFELYNFPITASIKGMVNGLVNYSPDSNILTAYANGNLKYWSTSSGLELKTSLPKNNRACRTFNRSDEEFIVAGSENGVIYSNINLEYFCSIPRNSRTTSEKFLPDGSIIALSLQNQLIQVWNVNNNVVDHQIKIQTPGDVWDVAISNDGKLLATASDGGAIEIYNIETMSHIKTLNLQTGPIYQIVFSNNNTYLIAGLADGTLRFFGLYP